MRRLSVEATLMSALACWALLGACALARPEGKKIAFAMDGKPWPAVFKWLADQTGVPVITSGKPVGAFTFTPPAGMTFTLGEVIDIINEGLLPQKIHLVNRGRNYVVAGAADLADLVPQLDPEDLDDPKLGRNDIVSVTFALKKARATDVGADVEKQMGPFKRVVAMERSNQLQLQDRVATLRRIKRTITSLDAGTKGRADPPGTFTHRCKYVTAAEADAQLRELMGAPAPPPQPGGPPGVRRWGRAGAVFPGMQPPLVSLALPIGDLRVSVNDATQTLVLTGGADSLAKARDLLTGIDKGGEGAMEIPRGEMTLKKYNVANGSSFAVFMALFADFPKASFGVVGGDSILAHAYPADHLRLSRLLRGSEPGEAARTVTIPAGEADPEKVAKFVLFSLGGQGFMMGGLTVDAVPGKNAVVVRGTPDQINAVKEVVEAMGAGGEGGGRARTISLGDGGNARLMADELLRLLPRLIKNPVEVIKPGAGGGPKGSPVSLKKDEGPPLGSRMKDPRTGDQGKPVRIFASGSRLLIASDDQEVVKLIQQLVGLYKKTPGKGDFVVIRLKGTSAADAAKALEAIFNDPDGAQVKSSLGSAVGMGRMIYEDMRQRGVPGASLPFDAAAGPRVRVVAHAATNSLLVQASPLDMLTIRDLLARAIDPAEGEEAARPLARNFVIKLEHAKASDVAYTIKELYRSFTRSSSEDDEPGARRFGPSKAGPTLAVDYDSPTNRLFISCPEAMFKDIKKLAEEYDVGAKDSTRRIRVTPVKGIDPALVQQVVDAMQGRVRKPAPGTPGQPQQPPAQPGGGNPGGFGPDGPRRGD